VRRTLQSIPLLLLISIILFLITTNAPGGALAPYLANPHITPADIVRLKHNLGLDQPVPIQYLKWLWHIVSSGDLGWSTSNSEPVVQAILDRAVATLELTISAFVIALSLGLSAGLFSAIKPYSFWDYFITTFAFFGQSMPVFWFALMLQLALAVHGIFLLENMNLEALAARRVYEFALLVQPLKIKGGTGSTVAPVALF